MKKRLSELVLIIAMGIAITSIVNNYLPRETQLLVTSAIWLLLIITYSLRNQLALSRLQKTLTQKQQALADQKAKCEATIELLRASERFYHDILEDIPEMVCRWLPDGRITYVNEAYCRYFSLSREELLLGARLPAFHPGAGNGVLDPAPYWVRPVVVVEFPAPQPDGTIRWQRWLDRALFDENGAIREFQSIGEDITDRKRAEDETQTLLEENRHLARMALAIQEEERARLARELHDELGQSLTAIRADAQCILRLNLNRDKAIDDCAKAINGVAGQVYNTVHEMMHRLRPVLLEDLGLRDALVELLEQWQHQHPDVDIRSELELIEHLPRDVQLAAFRIVQEALTNIAKHATAQQVEIRLQRRDRETLLLFIRDDGIGLDPAAKRQGYGLLGMRERVLALGGDFKLESNVGHGLMIRALLPLKTEVNLDEQ